MTARIVLVPLLALVFVTRASAGDAAPAGADIKLLGTFVNEVTGEETRWEALVTRGDDGRLSGTLDFGGQSARLHAAAIVDQQLAMEFTAPSGLAGIITGRLDGRRIQGAYTVGSEHGTWRGIATRDLVSP